MRRQNQRAECSFSGYIVCIRIINIGIKLKSKVNIIYCRYQVENSCLWQNMESKRECKFQV